MMSFIKFIMGMWAGWIALRIIRGVISAKLAQKTPDARIQPDGNTLELVACPKCGIYTAAPCPNCNP